jgi:hypothetical protein
MRMSGRIAFAVLAGALLTRRALPEGAERIRYETERATIVFEAGTLSEEEMGSFARLVDRGIADIESVVSPGLPPNARRVGRLRYVVTRRVWMSQTRGRTVFLPLERVRKGSAPYLHETTHALMPSRSECLWLSEGFASYLESWVSENLGGYDAHIFSTAGDRGIHDAARRLLKVDDGLAALPFVGRSGTPPGIFADRERVAGPYYVLSQSFLKFLVERTSVATVAGLFQEPDISGALAKATGQGTEALRGEWLRMIRAGPLVEAGIPPRSQRPSGL